MSAWRDNFYGTRSHSQKHTIRVGVYPRCRASCHFGRSHILDLNLGGADTVMANHREHKGHGVFFAFETETPYDSMSVIHGPFESRKAAEGHIRRDFEEYWNQSETPLADRDEDYSGTWLIVEQVAEVKPVAKATLKTAIVEVKK